MKTNVSINKISTYFRLSIRTIKLLCGYPKPFISAKLANKAITAAVPFVNIYFSSAILNELAGLKRAESLIILVAAALSINLLCALLKSISARYLEHSEAGLWHWMSKTLNAKFSDMDFADSVNPEIRQNYWELRAHLYGMGFGLANFIDLFDRVLSAIIQIIAGIIFCVPLFTSSVPLGSSLAFLDSPVAILIFAAVLLPAAVLAPYFSVKSQKVWGSASSGNNKSNRLFSFYYHSLVKNSDAAKDIRIYSQYSLIDKGSEYSFFDYFYGLMRKKGENEALSEAATYITLGFVYAYIALKALAGAFGVGSIVLFTGAATQLCSGFSSLIQISGMLLINFPYLEKTFEFVDIPNTKYKGTLAVEKRDDNDYEIEFKNVSFKYPQTDEYALQQLNLKLHIGEKLAVVGMNGSGKTTMVKLLCRLYDPTEGMITLNGIDIRKYDYDEYMSIFSVVFQDFELPAFTLEQNVAASVNVDSKRCTDCLEKAGFGPRLSELEAGTKTYLYKKYDESGVEISGGEAQKIALARALYKNAPFVILDEPTAALDPVAEYEIYSRFNEMVTGKTAIYISHRLSSCRFCDSIAVFNEGRLVQLGSHSELLCDKSGKYNELWNAQAQYYTDNQTA